ncbi:hypothetical protein CYMTET_26801 [Cymbomonas tetramitiformis]|uniref:S-acyltransferase n=1 Tax=Cymbomonas tetramitiformis TaxID=36881 RepID=A0AAE0FRD1_9CHLO|nr:hypothetical protein CYMTET_26801 [Cymbomonas tetramitiformis]
MSIAMQSSLSIDSGERPKRAATKVRNYQVWPGKNTFICKGRLIMGPDTNILCVTVSLITFPSAVFVGLVALDLYEKAGSSGPVILAFSIFLPLWCLLMLGITSSSDPGIIPRCPPPANGSSNISRARTVQVNGHFVKSKYCNTCNLYRPPRCSHCGVCDNCVERFDHHCPWVGQCIGKRNYRYFILFITSTTTLCAYVFICSSYLIKIRLDDLREGDGKASVWDAIAKEPAAMTLIVLVFCVIWFVGGLSIFHSYLIYTNQTTNENFRYRQDMQDNPYNLGGFRNYLDILCSSTEPSKLTLRAVAPEVKRPATDVADVQISITE